jgi:DNA replication protein DnaC
MKEALDDEIRKASKKLFLTSRVAELCGQEATPKQEEFLLHVLKEELAAREINKRHRLVKRANFPVYKTFKDYCYEHVQFPPAFPQEALESCHFVKEHKNIILYGPVGTGKTHLAIATGVRACAQGLKTKFFSVTGLVLKLAEARQKGTLEKLTMDLQKQDLLILDEWGYVPIDSTGSQMLFRIIADSYERKSLILTTNLEFSKWGSIFTDEQMTAAMIDRLAHHGHLLLFNGRSYRMEHALMRQETDRESVS